MRATSITLVLAVAAAGCRGSRYRFVELARPRSDAVAAVQAEASKAGLFIHVEPGCELVVGSDAPEIPYDLPAEGRKSCIRRPVVADGEICAAELVEAGVLTAGDEPVVGERWCGSDFHPRYRLRLHRRDTDRTLLEIADLDHDHHDSGRELFADDAGQIVKPDIELGPQLGPTEVLGEVFLDGGYTRDPVEPGLVWRLDAGARAGLRLRRHGPPEDDVERPSWSLRLLGGPGIAITATGVWFRPELTLTLDRQRRVRPFRDTLPVGPRIAFDLGLAALVAGETATGVPERDGVELSLGVRWAQVGGVVVRGGYLFGPSGGPTVTVQARLGTRGAAVVGLGLLVAGGIAAALADGFRDLVNYD